MLAIVRPAVATPERLPISSRNLEDPVDDIFSHIDALLTELRISGQEPKAIRVGSEIQVDFESQAGAAYINGRYFDIPVTFDAIAPTSVLVESEPRS